MHQSTLLILTVLALGCGPVGPIPGGSLSGEGAAAPDDWSFSDAEETVQLETRPGNPYSVNIWGAGIGDHFYVASGDGGEAAWAQHIAEDPNVRLRISDRVYALRAVRVQSEADLDQFLQAVKRKYDWEPSEEQRANAWVFRLEPR